MANQCPNIGIMVSIPAVPGQLHATDTKMELTSVSLAVRGSDTAVRRCPGTPASLPSSGQRNAYESRSDNDRPARRATLALIPTRPRPAFSLPQPQMSAHPPGRSAHSKHRRLASLEPTTPSRAQPHRMQARGPWSKRSIAICGNELADIFLTMPCGGVANPTSRLSTGPMKPQRNHADLP